MSVGEPFCFALWCDDVRQEVGNKPSFMGVYTGGLVVPALPVTLPRLTAWVVLSVPIGMPLVDVSVSVHRDDGVELAGIAPFNPEVPQDAQRANGVQHTRAQLMFALTLAPVHLPEKCRYLNVTAKLGELSLEASKLHIQVGQPDAGASAASPARQ